LRLGRLECLVALYRIADVREDVEALSRRTDLGEHEGSVLLWQALLAMYGAPRVGQPHELVPKALARDLRPAEREYAQVFIVTTAPEAIAHLRKALEIDPFYSRAYDPLLMLLMMSGRLEEASVVLGQARLVLPRSANLLSSEALLYALRGDTDGTRRAMDRIEKEFGSKPATLIRPVIRMFSAVAREDFHWQGLSTADLVTVTLELLRARQTVGDLVGDAQLDPSRLLANLFLSLPLLQGFADFPLYKALLRGEMPNLAKLRDPKEGAEMFGRISRRLPEGTFLMLHGVMLQQLGRWAEAEQAFQAALVAPAFTHVRQRALVELIYARFNQASSKQPFDPDRRKQIVTNLGELLPLGPLPPVPASEIIGIALALGEPYALAHNGLGAALYANKEIEEAIAAYCRAVEIAPTSLRLITTSASPCTARRTWTGPSPSTIGSSRSTRTTPRLTTTSASACTARRTWTAPSASTAGRSQSTRTTPRRTATWVRPAPAGPLCGRTGVSPAGGRPRPAFPMSLGGRHLRCRHRVVAPDTDTAPPGQMKRLGREEIIAVPAPLCYPNGPVPEPGPAWDRGVRASPGPARSKAAPCAARPTSFLDYPTISLEQPLTSQIDRVRCPRTFTCLPPGHRTCSLPGDASRLAPSRGPFLPAEEPS